MTASILDSKHLEWPQSCTDVCFLRLQIMEGGSESHNGNSSPSWYSLTNPSLGVASDFSALADLRLRQNVKVTMSAKKCDMTGQQLAVKVSIAVAPGVRGLLSSTSK
jgi:hypothetical protein